MHITDTNVKVSVITTVYNAVTTIEDTILSVLDQTYANIEYIVIDGGSTDGTLKVINKYRHLITHVISEPDNGIADGFNKGIALATGEWVGMINADDWYTLNAVQTMLENMTEDDDVFCGNIMLVGQNYARIKKSKVGWLNLGMFVMHPTCFIRSKVYKGVGKYDPRFKIAMDFDMMLRIRNRGFKIKYVDELVAYMRTGGASGNISRMHREEMAVMRRHMKGLRLVFSETYKWLDVLRWRYFYRDPFNSMH